MGPGGKSLPGFYGPDGGGGGGGRGGGGGKIVFGSLKETCSHFETIENYFSLFQGRNNLFHAVLFFLYHVKREENGMLG